MSLFDYYFKKHDEAVEKYGERIVVIMQVGSFYEIYATQHLGPNLDKICEITELAKMKRNRHDHLSKTNPYMAGFPSINYSIWSKHIFKLNKEGYTVVRIEQSGFVGNLKRRIAQIHNPPT